MIQEALLESRPCLLPANANLSRLWRLLEPTLVELKQLLNVYSTTFKEVSHHYASSVLETAIHLGIWLPLSA